MTEEEFSALSTYLKWQHLSTTMQYIVNMDSAYSMRVRLNPHHPDKDKKQEQRDMRVEQYQRWQHVKALYSMHRDELANTLENEEFAENKSIFERIFSNEVDDALRSIIGEES